MEEAGQALGSSTAELVRERRELKVRRALREAEESVASASSD